MAKDQVACLLVALLPISAAAEIPPIPSRMSGRTAPAWISASEAIDDQGRFVPEAFGAHDDVDLLRIEEVRGRLTQEQRSEPCAIELGQTTWLPVEPRPTGTLEELVRLSAAYYIGTVAEVDTGFYYGLLGTLLRVDIGSSHRTSKQRADEVASIYVFVQSGHLRMGEVEICKLSRRPLPAADRRIVVFYGSEATADTEGQLLVPDDSELFFEHEDGSASLPYAMRLRLGPDHRIGFDELLHRLDAYAVEAAP